MKYNRINIDGKSITETRVTAAALLPGTFAVIDATDKFAQVASNATPGRMYIVGAGTDGVETAVASGVSAVADYVEDAREFAARVTGPIDIKKDSALTVGTGGKLKLATEGTDVVVAYAQEALTVATGDELVRVRVQRVDKTPTP